MFLRSLTLAIACLAPIPAAAATIGTFVHDYGSGPGEFDPNTNDPLRPDFVRVGDNPTGDTPGAFVDSFSLASLAGAVIESITLTITYARTNANETWFFDVYGSNPNSFIDNAFTTLASTNNAQQTATLTLSAANDVGGVDAFATSLANLSVRFGFEEATTGADNFRLFEAVLTVNGTATVPLPAPVLLLLAGLGGLAAARRRQLRNAAAV